MRLTAPSMAPTAAQAPSAPPPQAPVKPGPRRAAPEKRHPAQEAAAQQPGSQGCRPLSPLPQLIHRRIQEGRSRRREPAPIVSSIHPLASRFCSWKKYRAHRGKMLSPPVGGEKLLSRQSSGGLPAGRATAAHSEAIRPKPFSFSRPSSLLSTPGKLAIMKRQSA